MRTTITKHTDRSKVRASDVPHGFYIQGMYLEGAHWDRERGMLIESYPSELYDELPIMLLEHYVFEERKARRLSAKTQFYECPVYKIVQRSGVINSTGLNSNFVLDLSIRIGEDRQPAEFTMMGTAIFLSLKY